MEYKLRQAWMTALESGVYKQGQKQLRRYDTFCILGVLCEEARRLAPQDYHWEGDKFVVNYTGEEFTLLPPPGVFAWTEWVLTLDMANYINSCGLAAHREGELTTLQHLNDIGMSFADICDFIEEFGVV